MATSDIWQFRDTLIDTIVASGIDCVWKCIRINLKKQTVIIKYYCRGND